MANQKLEDQLSLALDTPAQMREKSDNLDTGYAPSENTWELIVKYNGNLDRLTGGIRVEPLIAGYAIVTIPENLIGAFSRMEEIEFIEKPKKLYPQVTAGLGASCFYPLLQPVSGKALSGQGVYMAILDSGIDYTDPMFRYADGTTKIAWLWDQGKRADAEKGEKPPQGFFTGVEYSRKMLNANLQKNSERLTTDVTGHGTNVAKIAVQGAPESELIVVKLDTARGTYPSTVSLLRAFTYVAKKAQAENMPVAINLSYGNTYGAHDGSSLLERFIDNITEVGRNVICIGAGNEGASAGHFAGKLSENEIQRISFAMGTYERSFSLQLWKWYADRMDISILSPAGEQYLIRNQNTGGEAQQAVMEQTKLLIFSGRPQPYRKREEVYIDFIPVETYLNTGIWTIEITPRRIANGELRLYMPSAVVRSENTRFLLPSPAQTLTIPSTAQKVITVGAYNAYVRSYAAFSGRGDAGNDRAENSKPDLAAPGVNIRIGEGEGGAVVSGTSYATPFVTAAAALLMEYGIVQGNDPFLYGEKVKAYLHAGARQLPGYDIWPNDQVGWGALCVSESLPEK
ncbi:MAG TPA: peptidase S8 [Lachnospiraceae bacterium]|nr:peptidase S8 [Lachnospiraceae bacterium]HCX41294.1 peptidase S8 [Lachnospiraceae bacterium]